MKRFLASGPTRAVSVVVLSVFALGCALGADAADPAAKSGGAAEAKKISADDLRAFAEESVASLKESVADEEAYKDSQEGIVRDANVLIVVATTLGLCEQAENKQSAGPAAMSEAAEALAKAKDYAAAKKAVEALDAAVQGKAPPAKTGVERPAKLDQLMKGVPAINSKLKRGVKPERLKTMVKQSGAYSAAIAAIALESTGYAEQAKAKTPEEAAKWRDFCKQMLDAADEVNRAVHAQDASAVNLSMDKLAKSCEDCHAVFHKEASGAN